MSDINTLQGEHRLIIAGFGGQGILTAGKLLCNSAIAGGMQVTYLPSYGTEVRGGTANCHVVISPEPIFSPYVESADSLIILNRPSLARFAPILKPSALLVVNSSLVTLNGMALVDGATVVEVSATETAADMGNVLVANSVMLGAFAEAGGLIDEEAFELALRKSLGEKKPQLIDVNLEAFQRGRALVN